jgi:hypothetical protein
MMDGPPTPGGGSIKVRSGKRIEFQQPGGDAIAFSASRMNEIVAAFNGLLSLTATRRPVSPDPNGVLTPVGSFRIADINMILELQD